MQAALYSGAKLTLSISGNVVGAGFVMDYRIDTRMDEIEGIDTVFPVELAPSKIKVSMNMRVYRHPDNDPVVLQYAPGTGAAGSAEQAGFLASPYVTVEIKDSLDQTILYIPQFMIESRSGSVSMGDFLTEFWSGRGIGYRGPSAG
jgi:hypothetical protein